jgi:tetraacyldisaccharide 4'-kinase
VDASRASRVWVARDARSNLLLPLAALYGALAALRRALYRLQVLKRHRLAVPVIVVGNIVVGGAGKTPLVIALVEKLKQLGFHPGVVSRGYGGTFSSERKLQWRVVQYDDARLYGDEIVLIKKRCGVPCAIGRQRVAAARGLLQQHAELDVLVCDDGLQHYALARDVELAVFDQRGVGNGRLLPAGPLREPLSRLATADAILVNGGNKAELSLTGAPLLARVARFDMLLKAGDAWQLVNPSNHRSLSSFASEHLSAVAGIGDPSRFFRMLQGFGLQPRCIALADHAAISVAMLAAIDASAILMTEKDAVKCTGTNDARLWSVPVSADIESELMTLIVGKLNAPR